VIEHLEFDPAFRDVGSAQQQQQTLERLDVVNARVDRFFENLEIAPTGTRGELSKAFRDELLGMDADELPTESKPSFTKVLSKASLAGLLDLQKQ